MRAAAGCTQPAAFQPAPSDRASPAGWLQLIGYHTSASWQTAVRSPPRPLVERTRAGCKRSSAEARTCPLACVQLCKEQARHVASTSSQARRPSSRRCSTILSFGLSLQVRPAIEPVHPPPCISTFSNEFLEENVCPSWPLDRCESSRCMQRIMQRCLRIYNITNHQIVS